MVAKKCATGAYSLLAVDANKINFFTVDSTHITIFCLRLILRQYWPSKTTICNFHWICLLFFFLLVVSLRKFNHTHIFRIISGFFFSLNRSSNWKMDIKIYEMLKITYSSSSGVKNVSWPALSSIIYWTHAVQYVSPFSGISLGTSSPVGPNNLLHNAH